MAKGGKGNWIAIWGRFSPFRDTQHVLGQRSRLYPEAELKVDEQERGSGRGGGKEAMRLKLGEASECAPSE